MTSVDFLAAWHAVLLGNYDLIHLHHIEACFVLPVLKLRYKVVCTAHGRIAAGNKWGKLAASAMRAMEVPYGLLSDAATSVSEVQACELADRFHRTVRYIPNGVDAAPHIAEDAALGILKENRLEPDSYVLFAAGRLIPLKGAHLVLEGFRRLKSNCRLLLIGDSSALPEYSARLRSGADGRAVFVPFIESQAALLGLIRVCRLFVFPSMDEAMSMMLLEAASVGAPIVCSDIPANRDVLSDAALYFESGNVEDLADKLGWALEHPGEMRALGERAQSRVRQDFAWDSIADRYEALYHDVIENRV
jgi:glycosyltransferase involved in cell wall biosynthesis